MRKTAKILIIIYVFSTLSCNQQKKINKTEHYDRIASEFITQIFSSENYECSYIIKPNSEYNPLEMIEKDRPILNYRNVLMKIFKIKEKKTLDSLLNLSNNFEFRNSMFQQKTKLIDYNQFIKIKTEFDSIAKYGTKKEKERLFSNCSLGFYFISKPIFDKEYKTAVIDIQMAFTCFGRLPLVFKLNNGVWKYQDKYK